MMAIEGRGEWGRQCSKSRMKVATSATLSSYSPLKAFLSSIYILHEYFFSWLNNSHMHTHVEKNILLKDTRFPTGLKSP